MAKRVKQKPCSLEMDVIHAYSAEALPDQVSFGSRTDTLEESDQSSFSC